MGLLKKFSKKTNDKDNDDIGFSEELIDGEVGKNWLDSDYEEGQLSIDVFQDEDNLIVKSTLAGVKPENIDVAINNDMLTIRGKREEQVKVKEENYLYKECYWGSFSRSIILPFEVKAEKIEATMESGILTITLPKLKKLKQVSIKVKEKNGN